MRVNCIIQYELEIKLIVNVEHPKFELFELFELNFVKIVVLFKIGFANNNSN
jgi:hypothetical protein